MQAGAVPFLRVWKGASVLLLGGALIAAPVREARAGGDGAAVVSGVLGFALGAIAGSAMNNQQRPGNAPAPTQRAPKRQKPVRAPDQTVLNAQTALKYFGFYNGSVDGVSGPGTRQAIAAFQAKVGEEPTGKLTPDQYAALMQIYADRGSGMGASGPAPNDPGVDQLFAAISRGPDDGAPARAVPAATTATNVATGAAAAGTAAAAAAASPASQPVATDEPVVALVEYNDVCIGRNALKSADATAGEIAIRQHFCGTHALAVAAGNAAIDEAEMTDMDVVLARCEKTEEAIDTAMADVSTAEPAKKMEALSGQFAGMTEEAKPKAVRNFVICTGVGLNALDAGVVNAASLALAALGNDAYLEFVASSLAIGIGEGKDSAAAAEWYDYLASRPVVEAPGSGMPVLKAADVAAFRAMASGLRAGGDVQIAKAESLLVPQFDQPAADPQEKAPPEVIQTAKTTVGGETGGTPGPVAADSSHKGLANSEIAEILKDSIVVIYDPKGGTSGTGFMIGPRYILTNSHVVQEADRVVVASRRYGVRAANVVAKGMTPRRVGIDAAVLETVNWTADKHLAFSTAVREGEPVAIGGFPGRASESDRSSERFFSIITQNRIPTIDDIPAPKFDFGYVQSLFTDSETGLKNIQEGLETSPGNSGSPVTNSCGDVVGLHYQGSVARLTVRNGQALGDTSKYNYAITSDEVLKFLKSINIRYDVVDDPCR
ncbi:Peptidoglycan-binding (PGRP) domain of peptidoglycan hydrolases-containing protein [Pseudoxanthobacter soli DSM 19599]|uniref:Peptidoglycan-binding (PGRP) domain of peptidoglycan hydrolases-containing protein n=1 Tax=Pseudoxanthobacter soli DSM 19599 TaxID=1123029 RepID=A0A1M7Z5M9_9HYPH|nr:Peptidoglycan-binding (PGRP) domain of peptidoglycan hydrolases-containing protein [Pseudoxanthobacter soli DSM 19599]